MQRWPVAEAQSALVILVPEAEHLVSGFRAAHDPSAAAGVPAHVTILYPFMAPEKIGAGTTTKLRKIFGAHPVFRYMLSAVRCFPDTVYLAPEPDGPIRALTTRVSDAFPNYPPYEGKHRGLVPHLTVGSGLEATACDRLAEELIIAAHGSLPISATVTEIALLDSFYGGWKVSTTFSLSAAGGSGHLEGH